MTLFLEYRVWSISPILFDIEIPNLVCGFLFGWRNGAYHLDYFDLDIDFWPHSLVVGVLGISSSILQPTFLKCVLC